MQATALPLWAFALAAAVFAPFCARALAQALDKRARERTLEAFAASQPKSALARRTESASSAHPPDT